MNTFDAAYKKVNLYQQRFPLVAFTVAVIKKYGEDSAGRQAALLTYYTYLSLFPLLLILTTITDALVGKGSSLGDRIISGLTNYFPVLGNQLSQHVHSLNETGLALVIGVLFLLYGTRGVAEAFINGVQHIWMVSDSDNVSFYERLARSFTLVFIGGLGLLAASVLAGLTSTANHSVLFRLLSLLVNFLILFWLFRIVLNISLPRHISPEETRAGSAVAAIGLVVLQLLGGYIISHELKHLSALYSYFALSLGLLFWIYLQSQLIFYAIEIAIVKSQNLWPRSMDSQTPSKADRQLSDQVR